MDIRTWQEADRPDLPEPGFGDDPVVHGAPAGRSADGSGTTRPPFGAFGGPESGTAFTATDVISLGPADRSDARGARSAYSARHRSGRSPFSPLRPAPIAIGSLSTAAIAAFAFVGPGILHGGDAGSTMPVLDGMPHRIAPLTPGSSSSASSPASADPSTAGAASTGLPSATATGSRPGTGPTSSANSDPGGHTGGTSPSAPGSPTAPSTGTPSSPGRTVTPPTPPTSDPSPPTTPPGPPSQPPSSPPWGPISPPVTPPGQPTPPAQPPTSTPAPVVFNSSAAVSSALTEIAKARTSQGAVTLAVDPVLEQAASKHTKDMVHSGRFSHTGSDGSNPYSRAQSLGCWTLSKELIARGRPGDDVVGAMLQNALARPALLASTNRTIGVSAQQDPKTGDVYWTIELAWM